MQEQVREEKQKQECEERQKQERFTYP